MAKKKKALAAGLTRVEPTWAAEGGEDGEGPITEFLAGNQGALSPFGDDLTFPLPASSLHYEHPTARPNH